MWPKAFVRYAIPILLTLVVTPLRIGHREEGRSLPHAHDGQTCELRRSIGHLARSVHRHVRSGHSGSLRQEADLSRARHPAQRARATTVDPQRTGRSSRVRGKPTIAARDKRCFRANFVELEDGTIRRLLPNNLSQRTAVAKLLLTREKQHGNTTLMSTKKVYRHLRTGDYVLANRQPTLHRPSIQAHMVRRCTLRAHTR